MSESQLIWLFGACFSLSALAIGLIARHVLYCKDVGENIASIKTTVESIKAEIGTHESGIRGQLHSHQNALVRLDSRVESLEER